MYLTNNIKSIITHIILSCFGVGVMIVSWELESMYKFYTINVLSTVMVISLYILSGRFMKKNDNKFKNFLSVSLIWLLIILGLIAYELFGKNDRFLLVISSFYSPLALIEGLFGNLHINTELFLSPFPTLLTWIGIEKWGKAK